MKTTYILGIIWISFGLLSCQNKSSEPLPFLGRTQMVDGIETPHTIRSFSLINQDSVIIDNKVLDDHIYMVDYFFTSCPSICPIVKKQMLRLYDRYEAEPLIKFMSISMDTKRDSVPRLKDYANKLGVDHNKWWFLTGEKDLIFSLNEDFFIAAYEDNTVPGGFDHSGKIILVDTKGRVRAFAEGTDADDVTDFFSEVDQLLTEEKEEG